MVNWILENNIKELNVGGSSETKSPGAYQAAFNIITQLLQRPELTKATLKTRINQC